MMPEVHNIHLQLIVPSCPCILVVNTTIMAIEEVNKQTVDSFGFDNNLIKIMEGGIGRGKGD